MKKILSIIAVSVMAIAMSATTNNADNHQVVYFAEGDMFYHATYTHAKQSARMMDEGASDKVYMQFERGAKCHMHKCPICYGFNINK